MKPSSQRRSKPSWLKKALPPGGKVGRIEKLVSRLRHKIEPNPEEPRYLITVRGRGYKLASPD